MYILGHLRPLLPRHIDTTDGECADGEHGIECGHCEQVWVAVFWIGGEIPE